MSDPTDIVRQATRGTPFEGHIYLVGGVLRDRVLGLPARDDIDIVTTGDSQTLARSLWEAGVSDHAPVLYPRFGTARVQISGTAVEIVTARAESYDPSHRKPDVRPATLVEDVLRRDFTINTLVEGIHSGVIDDLTGRAFADIAQGVIRTPLEPSTTFHDDPLRMLRAVRFAVRFGFAIHEATWTAIVAESRRLELCGIENPVVSAERVRDEFLKILGGPHPEVGLGMLHSSGLLARFAPELAAMKGVAQNAWHNLDVWDHATKAVASLPETAELAVRLGVLFHDVGKPPTRTEDERGIHFYDHQTVGADLTAVVLQRLKLSGNDIRDVGDLVRLHMRLGEVRPDWSDAAIRRLIRDTHPHAPQLFAVAGADMAAMSDAAQPTDLDAVRARIDEINRQSDAAHITSPLSGLEVMSYLGCGPSRIVGEAKDYLVNEVIEGRLPVGSKEAARAALFEWHEQRTAATTPSS